MFKFIIIVLSLLTTLILFPSEDALAQKTLEQIQTSLEKRIRFAQQHERFICGGEYIYDSSLLAGFYNDQNYSPSWFSENGLKNEVKTLINTIKEAELEGLNPNDYHLTAIEDLMAELQTCIETNILIAIEKLVDLDLSVRALNCLKAAEVESLGDLVKFNKNDLLKFRNFGKKSLTELDELLETMNLSFGMDVAKYKLDKD